MVLHDFPKISVNVITKFTSTLCASEIESICEALVSEGVASDTHRHPLDNKTRLYCLSKFGKQHAQQMNSKARFGSFKPCKQVLIDLLRARETVFLFDVRIASIIAVAFGRFSTQQFHGRFCQFVGDDCSRFASLEKQRAGGFPGLFTVGDIILSLKHKRFDQNRRKLRSYTNCLLYYLCVRHHIRQAGTDWWDAAECPSPE